MYQTVWSRVWERLCHAVPRKRVHAYPEHKIPHSAAEPVIPRASAETAAAPPTHVCTRCVCRRPCRCLILYLQLLDLKPCTKRSCLYVARQRPVAGHRSLGGLFCLMPSRGPPADGESLKGKGCHFLVYPTGNAPCFNRQTVQTPLSRGLQPAYPTRSARNTAPANPCSAPADMQVGLQFERVRPSSWRGRACAFYHPFCSMN